MISKGRLVPQFRVNFQVHLSLQCRKWISGGKSRDSEQTRNYFERSDLDDNAEMRVNDASELSFFDQLGDVNSNLCRGSGDDDESEDPFGQLFQQDEHAVKGVSENRSIGKEAVAPEPQHQSLEVSSSGIGGDIDCTAWQGASSSRVGSPDFAPYSGGGQSPCTQPDKNERGPLSSFEGPSVGVWRTLEVSEAAQLLLPERDTQGWLPNNDSTKNRYEAYFSEHNWRFRVREEFIYNKKKGRCEPKYSFRLSINGGVESERTDVKTREFLREKMFKDGWVNTDIIRNSRITLGTERELLGTASVASGGTRESSVSSSVSISVEFASAAHYPTSFLREHVQQLVEPLDGWSPISHVLHVSYLRLKATFRGEPHDMQIIEHYGNTFKQRFDHPNKGNTTEAINARNDQRDRIVKAMENMFDKLKQKPEKATVNEVFHEWVEIVGSAEQKKEWEEDYSDCIRERAKDGDKKFQSWLDTVDTFFIISRFIDLDAMVRSHSMGIFWRMPRLLAKYLFFMIKHNTIVHDELLHLGFRSFAELGRTTGSEMNWDEEEEDVTGFSTICGYNTNECPARIVFCTSFSQRGVSQEHRDLTEQLSREFHTRGAVDFVEEMSEDDAQHEQISSLKQEAKVVGHPAGATQRVAWRNQLHSRQLSRLSLSKRPTAGESAVDFVHIVIDNDPSEDELKPVFGLSINGGVEKERTGVRMREFLKENM